MQNKGRCHDALLSFINDVGIPEHLVSDGAKEQGGLGTYKTNWNEVQRKYNIHQTFIQPHVPRQNTAELDIGHLSRAISRRLAIRCSPRKLWAYCGLFCAGIRQLTASTDPSAMGRTAFEQVHGYTPDITLYTRHEWYDMIWWFDSLDQTQKIGRWLGPCGRTFGAGDCYFILDKSARIHVTNSTKPIPEAHWKSIDAVKQMEDFNEMIQKKIGDDVKPDDAYFDGKYPDPPPELFDGMDTFK